MPSHRPARHGPPVPPPPPGGCRPRSHPPSPQGPWPGSSKPPAGGKHRGTGRRCAGSHPRVDGQAGSGGSAPDQSAGGWVHPRRAAPPAGQAPGRCLHRRCAWCWCPTPTGRAAAAVRLPAADADPAAARHCGGPGPRPPPWAAPADRRCRNCVPSAADRVDPVLEHRRDRRRCGHRPGRSGRPAVPHHHNAADRAPAVAPALPASPACMGQLAQVRLFQNHQDSKLGCDHPFPPPAAAQRSAARPAPPARRWRRRNGACLADRALQAAVDPQR